MKTGEGEWREDPMGQHERRWWDGSQWTGDISDGGVVGRDPHYSETPQATAIVQNPAVVKKGHGCLWALGIVGVLAVLGIVLIVVIAAGISKSVSDLNAEQQRHAITTSQFDAVSLGMTHVALTTQLGKTPENRQAFVTKGINSSEIKSSCVYYNKKGETFGSRFQFCFSGDSLDSKNSY